jgi:hypothetical protein
MNLTQARDHKDILDENCPPDVFADLFPNGIVSSATGDATAGTYSVSLSNPPGGTASWDLKRHGDPDWVDDATVAGEEEPAGTLIETGGGGDAGQPARETADAT